MREAETKIHKANSHHTIYLRKDLVEDSIFPFKVGQGLIVKIENDRLIIEKARK